jgi:hypothetical protein
MVKPELPKDAQIMNGALADAVKKAQRVKRYGEFKKLEEEGIQIIETAEIRCLTEADLDQVEGLKLCADSYIRVTSGYYYQFCYWKAVGTCEPDYLRIAPWYLNVAVCVCVCAR